MFGDVTGFDPEDIDTAPGGGGRRRQSDKVAGRGAREADAGEDAVVLGNQVVHRQLQVRLEGVERAKVASQAIGGLGESRQLRLFHEEWVEQPLDRRCLAGAERGVDGGVEAADEVGVGGGAGRVVDGDGRGQGDQPGLGEQDAGDQGEGAGDEQGVRPWPKWLRTGLLGSASWRGVRQHRVRGERPWKCGQIWPEGRRVTRRLRRPRPSPACRRV